MTDLVMLDLDAGPDFVAALQQVWEAGGAAFPLDRRLPAAEARRVVAGARLRIWNLGDLDRPGRGIDDGGSHG